MKPTIFLISIFLFATALSFPTETVNTPWDDPATEQPNPYWNQDVVAIPGVAPYISKVNIRLGETPTSPINDDIRERATNFVNVNLPKCKSPITGAIDKGCIGRLTGLTMGLINVLEGTQMSGKLVPWNQESAFEWKFSNANMAE